eukprot:TRINITY_DN431_c0_g1_i2.p1 TRINITY_DN431_c0_g1~~TRINITY_DN431_c0_g1_i2.p1  ORF type:complete len:155 (+),score=27.80 TRINITY_DN431_c0_g1_i2:157-621(+)
MDVESFLASVRKSKIIKFAKDTIPKTLEAIRREETLVQGDIVVFEIPGDALNRLISEELSAPSQAYTWLRILPHDWVEPFIQDRLATYDVCSNPFENSSTHSFMTNLNYTYMHSWEIYRECGLDVDAACILSKNGHLRKMAMVEMQMLVNCDGF